MKNQKSVRPWKFALGLLMSIILVFSIVQNPSFSAEPDTSSQTDVKDKKIEKPTNVDKKRKFDRGFNEKILDKINAGETREYDVIIYVKKMPVNGKDVKTVAKENKDKLTDDIIRIHKAKNIYKAKVLSFVTASVPLREIPKLADYDHVFRIGDGELKVELEMDVARPTVNAINLSGNGTGVKVAVIDSGINQTHADLPVNTKIVEQTVCQPSGCVSGSYDDDENHGTHVAGIIAGLGSLDSGMKGIAKGASILNVKQGVGFNSTALAKALDWSLEKGAKVINASFFVHNNDTSTKGKCLVSDYSISNLMVDEAVDEGALVVKSAGNQGNSSSTITNPGCGFNVLAVGAVDDKNTDDNGADDGIASFSSRGPFDGRLKPELVAPGVYINSTDYCDAYNDRSRWNDTSKTCQTDYVGNISGTSFAAPMASGAAALLLESQPQYSPLEVKAALLLGANWKAAVPMNATHYENNNSTDTTLNAWGLGVLNVNNTLTFANTGKNIIKDEITENKTKTYKFSANNHEHVKVILSWLNHPSGTIQNPQNTTTSNLDFVIKLSNGTTVASSTSAKQNNEFAIFNATAADTYTIEVSAKSVNAPFGIETFALASTHALTGNTDASFFQADLVHDISNEVGHHAVIAAADIDTLFICHRNTQLGDLLFSKSIDGGKTWTTSTVESANSVGSFCSIDAVDKETIFISHYDGTNGDLRFAKSSNGGTSWSTMAVDTAGSVGSATSIDALDANTIYIVYRNGSAPSLKYAKSGNGGSTWTTGTITSLDAGSYSTGRNVKIISSTTVYVSFWDFTNNVVKFGKTTDGGSTWTFATPDSSCSCGKYNAIDAVNSNTIFISYQGTSSLLKYAKSTDSGSTWTKGTIFASSSTYTSIDAVDSDKVFVSFIATGNPSYLKVAKTTNGGSSWSITTIHKNPDTGSERTSIVAPNSGSMVYVAYQKNDNLMIAFSDDEISVVTIDTTVGNYASIKPYNSTLIYVSYLRSGSLYYAKSTNGGNSWTTGSVVAGGSFSSIDIADANTIYIAHAGSNNNLAIAKSTNGGTSWNTTSITNTSVESNISIDVINANTVYVAYTMRNSTHIGLGFAKTTNGTNWSASIIEAAGIPVTVGRNPSISAVDTNNIFIVYGKVNTRDLKLAKSSNGGTSWSTSNIVNTGSGSSVEGSIHALDSSTLYVSYHNRTSQDIHFIKSTDGGTNWSANIKLGRGGMSGGAESQLWASDQNTIYIAFMDTITNGIMVGGSTDAGDIWTLRHIDTASDAGSSSQDKFMNLHANRLFFAYREDLNTALRFAKL